MRPVYVRGLGLWTPGRPDPEAWCRGETHPDADAPAAASLDGPIRRRATRQTRMAIEALYQAVKSAGFDPATTPTVWATAHGEHSTAIKLLKMMHRGSGRLSPTHFHNSVHNTPSGYASIAAHNQSLSTTVTGGREIVGAALLEAFAILETTAPEVVLVLSDEALQSPFERAGASTPLAVAFAIGREPDGALAAVSNLRRAAVAPSKPNEHHGRLFVSAALPLLERVVQRRPGSVALELEEERSDAVWCVDLELVAS
jgi:hypothetical protein